MKTSSHSTLKVGCILVVMLHIAVQKPGRKTGSTGGTAHPSVPAHPHSMPPSCSSVCTLLQATETLSYTALTGMPLGVEHTSICCWAASARIATEPSVATSIRPSQNPLGVHSHAHYSNIMPPVHQACNNMCCCTATWRHRTCRCSAASRQSYWQEGTVHTLPCCPADC
jgi:hypothetical protein